MQQGLNPTQITTCMKCRKAPSRYHGTWGEEGLCRPCILAMEPAVRRKVLRELHPAERKRWQLDELAERARKKEQPRGEEPSRPTPGPARTGAGQGYTEPYRHREDHPATPRRDSDRHERRDHSRVFAELPVRFTVFGGTERPSSPLHGRTFRSVSKDLSAGGVRIQILDPALFEIQAGCGLRLEITVPGGASLVRGTGVVHNVVRTSQGRDAGHLCVQFDPLGGDDTETLRRFFTRGRSP
ncbi:MAG: PilZ domain-containing protein [Deferrisomatales bacterium]|nr:PilZ domain-containing protein [Deferrisomatales bacterium]